MFADSFNNHDFCLVQLLDIIGVVRYGPHQKVCELHQNAFFRPYVLDVAEYTIFDIQYLFQFAHLDSR